MSLVRTGAAIQLVANVRVRVMSTALKLAHADEDKVSRSNAIHGTLQ